MDLFGEGEHVYSFSCENSPVVAFNNQLNQTKDPEPNRNKISQRFAFTDDTGDSSFVTMMLTTLIPLLAD